MKNDKIFRKTVQIIKNENVELTHNSSLILMGSCFSNEIGKRLNSSGFLTSQPFGTIFNPMTLGDNLIRIYEKTLFTKNDLTLNNGVFFSWNHSGKKYNNNDFSVLLNKINNEIEILHSSLDDCPFLLLTFGTSIVYEHKRKIVGNCHKHPSNYFQKRILSVENIVSYWKEVIKKYPYQHFIFTVSPVRHYKDGIIENNRSKAVLILAIDQLMKLFPNQTSYFPSYEIVMDELRDYRFYNSDMIHPNNESVEYIWSKFQDAYMNKKTINIVHQCEKIRQSINHKPLMSSKIEYKSFLNKVKEKITDISYKTPLYNWEDELKNLDIKLLD
ncbi:MAG: hypothetical protein CL846_02330 [Crocinitomicaceae bacterium]|nr:hypothetical protein [Crocinitomicaceae bacterium]|tara:strand:- start:116 stop:1102 length:987 start_codon:yes stop_codon:yes gene_type:complete